MNVQQTITSVQRHRRNRRTTTSKQALVINSNYGRMCYRFRDIDD